MAADERPIDEAIVDIKPSFRGFRAALTEGLKKSSSNVSVTIPVKLDFKGVNEALAAFANSRNATVKVKTDLDKAHLRQQLIEGAQDANIRVKFDVHKTHLRAQLKAAAENLDAKIQLEVHKTHLRSSLQAAVAGMDDIKARIGVDLDAKGLYARVRAVAAAMPSVRIKLPAELDIDRTALRARVKAAVEGLGPVRVQAPVEVRVDTRRARREVNDLNGTLSQLFRSSERLRLINWGGAGARPINILWGALAAMVPVLTAMTASAIQASTALLGLGATAIGVAGTITSVALAFGSVSEYMKQLVAAQKADRQQAATAASKQVAQSGAISQAAYAERDAKWALQDANKQIRASEQALHDARVQAKRDLEDLIEKERDLRREQQRDRLSVEQTRLKYLDVRRNFFATPQEIEEARLDYLDALDKQKHTNTDLRRTRQDLKPARRRGVRNAPGVVSARDALEQARRAKIRAGDKVAGGGSITGTAPPSAVTQLAYLRSQLSPAARELADYLDTNQKVFTRLRQMQETAVLPGFLRALKTLMAPRGRSRKSMLDVLATGAARLGRRVGTLAEDLADLMTTKWFRQDIQKINRSNERSFDHVTDAATALFKPIIRLITAAAPQIERFTGWLETISKRFAAWIDTFTDVDLGNWFRHAGDEAKRWWKPVEDILVTIYNILGASLPSGNSFIERFGQLTGKLREWSASAAGQIQIKRFFDFFQRIDYERIARVIATMVTATALFKAGKFIANHPVLTMLGLLAKQYPDETQKFLEAVTAAMLKLFQFAADNPAAATAILAYISALKGLAVLKGLNLAGLMIPGIGGRAAAAEAGAAGAAGRLGAGASAANPYALAAVLAAVFGSQQYTRAGKGEGFFQPFQDFAANPNLSTGLNTLQMASPIGWAGYAAGTETGKKLVATTGRLATILNPFLPVLKKLIPKPKQDKTAKVIADEEYGYRRLVNNLQSFGKDSAITKTSMDNYIQVRKARVAEYVDFIRGSQGPIAATKEQEKQDRLSAEALSRLLTQYGWAKDKADAYAKKAFNVGATTAELRKKALAAKDSFDSMGNSLDGTKTRAQRLKDKSDDLKGTLDTLVGPHIISLSTKNYDTVKKQLDLMYATQHVLYNPNYSNSAAGADTVSSQNQYLDPKTGLPKPISQLGKKDRKGGGGTFGRAQGGPVWGAGTATSDSIPAMLSNGEYVMPAKTVRHYGLKTMEDMRARRFAKGGAVMPFVLNFPKKGFQFPDILSGYGPIAPYTGKTPKGLGAVSGLTGTMMAAVIDAHRRFPWATVNSGFRRNSITVTGHRSYHASGRATDWPASWELFNYFKAKYGPRIKELIFSPAGAGQVWNGRPHMYTGKVRDTHWNHVHLALANGGLAAKKFDTGGDLKPGYTLAYNGTGAAETVRTRAQEQALRNGGQPVRIDSRDIARLAAALMQGGNPQVNLDGRRVAEITNRYNYLPTGV